MSLLLIPKSKFDLHNRPPPTKHKKIIRCLHPLASCLLHLLPRRRLTLHLICLFVCPFVCLFGWLLCRLSDPCRCFPSRCVATPHRCAALRLLMSLSSCCRQVVALLRRRVVASSRRCIVASSRRRVIASLRLDSPCRCIASRSVVMLLSRFV